MSARIRTLRGFFLAIWVAGWAANAIGATPSAPEYQRDIRPLMERRCLVCHGCYDAPCQLKLDSYQGLARGGTKEQIYSTERLSPASPSRLFEDAQTTAGWRVLGFSPVLPDQQDAPRVIDGQAYWRDCWTSRSSIRFPRGRCYRRPSIFP